MYIDGKVVSVAYPDGVKGPTINEINSAEGTKTAVPDSNNPVKPVAPVDPGGLPSQIPTPTVNPDGTLPFVPGAKSYEYAGSGTQAPATTTTPPTTSGGGPSDYRPRGQEPMPITATTTPSGGGPSDYRPRQAEPMQNNTTTTTTTTNP
jgi:hypothetical protein